MEHRTEDMPQDIGHAIRSWTAIRYGPGTMAPAKAIWGPGGSWPMGHDVWPMGMSCALWHVLCPMARPPSYFPWPCPVSYGPVLSIFCVPWPCAVSCGPVKCLMACPMSYGPVLCPMALSCVLWPCPMSHGLSYVPWPVSCGPMGPSQKFMSVVRRAQCQTLARCVEGPLGSELNENLLDNRFCFPGCSHKPRISINVCACPRGTWDMAM